MLGNNIKRANGYERSLSLHETETDSLLRESSAVEEEKGLIKIHGSATRGTATPQQLMVNLVTAGLGTGIFTLPWSTAGASLFPAVAITGVVLALNAWTISIIIEAGERHQTFNLGALLGRLPGAVGKVAEAVANSFMWLSTYLCLVGYIIVIADAFHSSIALVPGHKDGHYERPLLVALAATIVLPLSFLDQRRLAMTSTLAVIATANVFALICVKFVEQEVDGTRPFTCVFGLSMGSIAMFSAMMQTVVIQMLVLPMYEELEDRTPRKFNGIVVVSFSCLFLLCAGFAVMGYLAFGESVSSNVLLSLPSTHWGHACRLCAAASVIAVFPLLVNPMIAPLRSPQLALRFGSMAPEALVGASRVCIVMASAFAALYVTDLGFVNVLNGAMSCGIFVAAVPSLVGLYLLDRMASEWRFKMYTLAIIGTICSLAGFVITDNYSKNLDGSACYWKSQWKR